MRTIVAGRPTSSGGEFAELVLGFDPVLFTGPAVETESERAARLDVASDVLTEMWREDAEAATYATLLSLAAARLRPAVVRRARGYRVCAYGSLQRGRVGGARWL
ncbi:hypothetical protein [Yinghuangia sp. YIM S09857]|uniref:hypothetical protein n=1 Tax=Yinghuangia sp. YIM S09857 TaxID=3436929 RepID=UPI003F53A996